MVTTDKPAALASAQPAQAGEYEGLAKRLEVTTQHMATACSAPMALWDDHSNACLQAASAIRTLEKERARWERLADKAWKDGDEAAGRSLVDNMNCLDAQRRAEAAEARTLAAEQRLAALSQPETVREAVEALEWYADQFCEHGRNFEGCGKLPDDDCAGCKARKALPSLRERPTDGWVLVPKEPTEAMCRKGFDALPLMLTWETMAKLYRAMLAVAPPRSTGEVG